MCISEQYGCVAGLVLSVKDEVILQLIHADEPLLSLPTPHTLHYFEKRYSNLLTCLQGNTLDKIHPNYRSGNLLWLESIFIIIITRTWSHTTKYIH